MNTEIPVVDVAGLYSDDYEDRAAVATEIGKAVDQIGFFYLTGHRVSEDTIRNVRQAAIDFFAMSDDDKMKCYVGNSKTHKGYVPEGEEDFDEQTVMDHKEALDIGKELSEDHPGVQQLLPFHGHNVWPPQLSGFRERVLKYYDGVYELSQRLIRAFAIYLNLEETALDDLFTDPLATLRLIHYPETPGREGSIGISEHEDFECVTILESDAPGLELDLGNGKWLDAAPKPGAFIVNIGEMLEVLTNGRVTPRRHRVRAVTQERYSFPFFLGCNYSTKMTPLPQFQGKGPFDTMYNGVTMGDHLWSAVMQTYSYLVNRVNRGEAELPSGTKIRRKEWARTSDSPS